MDEARVIVAKSLYYWDLRDDLARGVPPFDELAERYQQRYFSQADYVLTELSIMPEEEFQELRDNMRRLRSVGV